MLVSILLGACRVSLSVILMTSIIVLTAVLAQACGLKLRKHLGRSRPSLVHVSLPQCFCWCLGVGDWPQYHDTFLCKVLRCEIHTRCLRLACGCLVRQWIHVHTSVLGFYVKVDLPNEVDSPSPFLAARCSVSEWPEECRLDCVGDDFGSAPSARQWTLAQASVSRAEFHTFSTSKWTLCVRSDA